MLSNEIVMFATVINLVILGVTFWRTRQLSFSDTGYGIDIPSKSTGKTNEASFEAVETPENAETEHKAADVWCGSGQRPLPNAANQRRFIRPTPKRCVLPAQAAEILICHMQDEGHVGPHTAAEIDSHWANCCVLYDLEELAPHFVRAAIRPFHMGQRRLNSPELIHVRQRTGQERANLYRIPASPPLAMLAEDEAAIPAERPSGVSVDPGRLSGSPPDAPGGGPNEPPDAPRGGPGGASALACHSRQVAGHDKVQQFKARTAA